MTERPPEGTCGRFGESVEPYLDGELARDVVAAFESHLEDCSSCSRELALAAEIRAALRSLPRLEAPAPAVAAVLRVAREESAAQDSGWLRWPRSLAVRLAAAAALLAVLAAVLSLLSAPAPDPDSTLALDDPAVVRATLETKLALAHVARAQRKVLAHSLGDEILREWLIEPAARGLARTLPLGGANRSSALTDITENRG